MQEAAQVEAGVVVEDVLQLGVCEDTEDLVVGVHHLQSKLGGGGGGGGGEGEGEIYIVHCTCIGTIKYIEHYLERKEKGKKDMYMYMCKNTLWHIHVHVCTCTVRTCMYTCPHTC